MVRDPRSILESCMLMGIPNQMNYVLVGLRRKRFVHIQACKVSIAWLIVVTAEMASPPSSGRMPALAEYSFPLHYLCPLPATLQRHCIWSPSLLSHPLEDCLYFLSQEPCPILNISLLNFREHVLLSQLA